MDLILISLLSFASAMVTSLFGFGAGLILTPLLGFMMPLTEALGVAALVFLFTAGSKVIWYRHDINRQIYLKAFLLSLPGLFLGFATISIVDLSWFETGYAMLLILFAVNMLRNSEQTRGLLPKTSYPLLGGVLAALMHSGGVFFIRFCQFHGLNRMQVVGTVAATHFSMNIFKAVFFTGTGLVPPAYIYKLIPAYIAAIIGTRLGRMLLKNHVSERGFTIGMATLLILLALKYLF